MTDTAPADPWVDVELFDKKGKLFKTTQTLPFAEQPEIMVDGDRYFLLCEGGDYVEANTVHFLPADKKKKGS